MGTTPARMAPLILCSPELVSSLRYPITQLYRNSTPARWWGLNQKKIGMFFKENFKFTYLLRLK